MADEKIIDRIRKLQNMTVENGASEDEAETAMRMAMGLMARHGIEQSMIKGVEAPKAKTKRFSSAFKKHQLWCGQAAATLYGCKLLTLGGGKYGIEFVGRPDNIEAAEMTMFWLINQMDSFYKRALPKGLTQSARSEFRRTFKEACAVRIMQRARQMMDDIQKSDAAAQASTGSNALVVMGHFQQLAKENEDVLAGMAIKKGRPKKMSVGSGTLSGAEAGNQIKLRKEIG